MPPRGHNESSAQRDTEDTRHRHCVPRSPSVLDYPERIIHRQTCHRGFTIHEKSSYGRGKKEKLSDDERRKFILSHYQV